MKNYILAISLTLGALSAAPTFAQSTQVDVLKNANCGCCVGWMAYMDENNFSTAAEDVGYDVLQSAKIDSGVPESMFSCHTSMVDGYVIEGHVPAADIRRLLEERPDAVGLAVPGMVFGSPGMGPEDERDAYDVFLIKDDGATEVFTSYSES